MVISQLAQVDADTLILFVEVALMKMMKISLVGSLLLVAVAMKGQTSPSQPIYNYSVPSNGYAPNSNLTNYTDSVTGTWNAQYDNLNRLTNVTSSAGPYNGLNLQWQYDSFGNRLSQTPSGSSASVPNPISATYNTNNQIQTSSIPGVGSSSYDAAGNQTFDGINTMLYDAEDRICAVSNSLTGQVTQYVYNAEGQRVAKGHSASQPGALVCPSAGDFQPTATYVLGPNGEEMTELNSSGNWQHTNIYANGELLATYDQEGSQQLLHFNIADPLGSKRVQASASGNTELNWTNLPFGDSLNSNGTGQDATEHHFTGKERDTESGLDYFGARHYASSMGRFMSPDPSGLYFANPANPQTLNLYSYVLNNPLVNIDPSGLDCATDNGEGTVTFNSGDCANESTDAANHEYYINCDGCTSGATGAHLDTATGSLYATDANGNGIAGTTVQGFADPQGVSTTATVNAYATYLDNISGYGVSLDSDNQRILQLATNVANQTKFVHCLQESEGKNGIALGLDAAGFIPGEGLAHAGVQYGIALASSANSIVNGDTLGRNMGAAGSGVALVDAVNNIQPGAPAWAKAVPFVGTIVNGVATAHDLSSAYKDYQACMSHP